MRQSIARLLVGVLLFAQLAIAAYACPGLAAAVSSEALSQEISQAAATEAPAMAAMDCAQMQMDPEAPKLCFEHCQFGKQSADHASPPAVAAAALVALYTLPVPADAGGRAWQEARLRGAVAGGALPHAILHCCFRI